MLEEVTNLHLVLELHLQDTLVDEILLFERSAAPWALDRIALALEHLVAAVVAAGYSTDGGCRW